MNRESGNNWVFNRTSLYVMGQGPFPLLKNASVQYIFLTLPLNSLEIVLLKRNPAVLVLFYVFGCLAILG
jgi:hypothetical protein